MSGGGRGGGVASGLLKSVDFLIKMQNVISVVNSNKNDTIDNDTRASVVECVRLTGS